MKKRRPLRGVLAALPLIVAYFLLFPYPLGREVVLRARWRVALPAEGAAVASPARTGAGSAAETAPFQLGDLYGFVSPDGELASLARTPFRVALSRRGSVAYARIGGTWVLDGPSGQPLASFSGDGYPLLSPEGDRIFLVKTDLTGLSELGESGETAWTRDFPSLLTSVAIAGDWLAAGLLNGSVALVDRQGAVVFEAAPAGSRTRGDLRRRRHGRRRPAGRGDRSRAPAADALAAVPGRVLPRLPACPSARISAARSGSPSPPTGARSPAKQPTPRRSSTLRAGTGRWFPCAAG